MSKGAAFTSQGHTGSVGSTSKEGAEKFKALPKSLGTLEALSFNDAVSRDKDGIIISASSWLSLQTFNSAGGRRAKISFSLIDLPSTSLAA